ncbi:MAG: CO dehydrogenase/acetyl-CoA synthase complex subunit epsilon [Candidatus Bathyarchaeia archaeon]
MISADAWQTAETPGALRGLPITRPEIIVAVIQRSSRPILVVGPEATETKLLIGAPLEYAIRMAEKTRAQVVATANVINEFLIRGFKEVVGMPIVDVANRLRDPDWKGFDGQGQYDLALFIGLKYYLGWTTLSGLKHYAPHLKTVSLDRFHQPNATWSFPNMSVDDWQKQLDAIITQLGWFSSQ